MIDIVKLMTQAKSIKNEIGSIKEDFIKKEFVGEAGGGAVKLIIYGDGKMKNIEIDDSIINSKEKSMLEDLIVTAFNNAKNKMDSELLGSFSDNNMIMDILKYMK